MSEFTSDKIDKAWAAYKKDRDPRAREFLLLAYAPLVKHVANRVAVGLPASMDVDDLISHGFFG